MINYIYDAISPETARYAMDYPWGYKLRTQQRYWIESKPKHGQRLCTQTLNPKTGKWCAVKKSTYSDIVLLTQDETNGHYGSHSVSGYTRKEAMQEFIEKHKANFSDFQKHQAKILLAWAKVSENITFEIVPSNVGPVSLMSNDPKDILKRMELAEEREIAREREENEMKLINRAVNREYQSIQM